MHRSTIQITRLMHRLHLHTATRQHPYHRAWRVLRIAWRAAADAEQHAALLAYRAAHTA